jgi:Domain of unknown function (DUF4349)
MRIIPFPGQRQPTADEAELEAALRGDATGPLADSWRQLREDVRALAPPMAPEFERELRERIARRRAGGRPRQEALQVPVASARAASGKHTMPTNPDVSGVALRRGRGRLGWMTPGSRAAAAATTAAILAVVLAVISAAPWRSGTPSRVASPRPTPAAVLSGQGASTPERASRSAAAAAVVAAPSVPGAPASAPARVQQLAASVSLAATPNDVQETADRVARLAVSDGGYVQSSHVQVQQVGASEANLMLRLPSSKLGGALASLGQLATLRAESQSLQDITDSYDAARQRVADAIAERDALLRALSKASTQGQIESLRERLSQARSNLTQARSSFQAISQRASTAEVEVTVVGDARAGGEGLTLHRGLHDAGRVLLVTLIVLLIAAAILVPLALLLAALAAGTRGWRRYQRERVLDPS